MTETTTPDVTVPTQTETPSAEDRVNAVGAPTPSEMRAALKEAGVQVGTRGRLSVEAQDAYYALQANNFAPGAEPNRK